MKIPEYLRNPVFSPGCQSLTTVARILEIDSYFYRKSGNCQAANALMNAARQLKQIGVDTSPAQAFDWPESTSAKACEHE